MILHMFQVNLDYFLNTLGYFLQNFSIYQARDICLNGILCSEASIVHSITQVPLIFLNHTFNFISSGDVFFTSEDFTDLHYLQWRNTMNPDFVFLELFYGPLFTSLSVSVFFSNFTFILNFV